MCTLYAAAETYATVDIFAPGDTPAGFQPTSIDFNVVSGSFYAKGII